jgi:hypothetical protein
VGGAEGAGDKRQEARKGDRSGFMGIFFLVGIIPFNGRVDYGMLESRHA